MSKVLYVIGHWTAGNYKPNAKDKSSYQALIDGSGNLILAKAQGTASSIGGMNSITYNVACCGGLDRTPITKVQQEAFWFHCARILTRYNLTPFDFYTHAEIGEMCGDKTIEKLCPWNKYLVQNIGKIDLNKMPEKSGQAYAMGDYHRQKIKWYYQKIN